MQDAWRAYLELALGLTEAPRKKAQTVVRKLVGSGGATAAQLHALAEEVVSTGLANREALTKIVRSEVDRALGVVGLATADEVAELTRRVRELERELREVAATAAGTVGGGVPAGTAPRPVAKKAVAKKTSATAARTPTEAEPAGPARPGTGKRIEAKKLPTPAVRKAATRKRAAEEGGA